MVTAKAQSNQRNQRTNKVETPREITNDVVEYLIDYAQQSPGYAALFCIGVGFVLGWKLKPW